MATTALMPRHADAGKKILLSIKKSLNYGKNPSKTRDGKLISSYQCDAKTAHIEFFLAKQQYLARTGRTQKNDILLYQLRQSFKPGEITPEGIRYKGCFLILIPISMHSTFSQNASAPSGALLPSVQCFSIWDEYENTY